MRRRGAAHNAGRPVCPGRQIIGAAIAVWLALGGFLSGPALVSAAPPEPEPGVRAETPITTEQSEPAADLAGPLALALPEPASETEEQSGGESVPSEDPELAVGSVRPHGPEAPVDLQQQAKEDQSDPQPAAEKQRDKESGDGPPPKREDKAKERDRAEEPSRVWPMPADSYTFSQAFGCVPQLGNLYFPGPGCPAEAPVIHTGIDLAAPEGTPFYAAASGWVTLAGFDRPTPDANTRIIIQHDGRNEDYATEYLHWVAAFVEEGDYVRAGQPLGEVGNVGYSTGPHLHFSVTDLRTGEHVDPMRWLPEDPDSDGYTGRLPDARFRLPPGTTAGHPEEADPAPPPPPKRQDVPESPAAEAEGDGDESRRRSDGERDKRRADRGKETGGKSDRGDRRSAKDGEEAAKDGKHRERTRTRERDKGGASDEAVERGKDSGDRNRERHADEESSRKDRRDERRSGESTSGDGDNSGKDRDRRNDAGKKDESGGKHGSDGSKGRAGADDASGKNGRDGGRGADAGDGETRSADDDRKKARDDDEADAGDTVEGSGSDGTRRRDEKARDATADPA